MNFSRLAILLTAFAVGASAAGITTNATADMLIFQLSGPPVVLHDEDHGTSFAGASLWANPMGLTVASAAGQATGTTFDVGATAFYYYNACNCAGADVRSASEVILQDQLQIVSFVSPIDPSTYLQQAHLWTIDVVVDRANASRAFTGLELRVNGNETRWGYSGQYPSTFPLTITAGASGSPVLTWIDLYLRVYANSRADGLGIISAQSRVRIDDIRVYDALGRQLTGFTYKSTSGMLYPVEGGTYLPEPTTATFFAVGGLLLLASHRRMRR